MNFHCNFFALDYEVQVSFDLASATLLAKFYIDIRTKTHRINMVEILF